MQISEYTTQLAEKYRLARDAYFNTDLKLTPRDVANETHLKYLMAAESLASSVLGDIEHYQPTD